MFLYNYITLFIVYLFLLVGSYSCLKAVVRECPYLMSLRISLVAEIFL
jgi:hypothetical protein